MARTGIRNGDGMNRRVVITGMGCVTALGTDVDRVWARAIEGRSAVRRLTLFNAEQFPVRIAAEVRDWDVRDVGLNPRLWEHCPRQTVFAIGAATHACRQAGVPDPRVMPLRFGVYLGCGEAFEDFSRFTESISDSRGATHYDATRFSSTALRIFDPEMQREYDANMPAQHLASLFNAQGPNANCIAACVSSTQAIGRAASLIRRGAVDMMICGGAHSTIHPFGVTGFHRLSALSTRNDDPTTAVRPFDRERDGFVIGEGAGMLVIESLEHARSRNAEILAEVTGYGSAQDAYRVTDTHPDGRGTIRAMQRALHDAELAAADIDYCNAHGTGTVLNDKVETLALKHVFGAHAPHLPVSSTKSMIGHATTACGAIELIMSVQTLRHSVLHPTINYGEPDPDCDLDYVPNEARDRSCRHVLSNSIGFGGQNAALIVSSFDERMPWRTALPRAA